MVRGVLLGALDCEEARGGHRGAHEGVGLEGVPSILPFEVRPQQHGGVAVTAARQSSSVSARPSRSGAC